jgi:multicomponent K+:H+ antiporter subunit D
MTHWIIAPIVLPVLVGAFLVLAHRRSLVLLRAVSGVGAAGVLALASLLIVQATQSAPQAYHLGDWPAPFGIVLVLDRLSALMVLVTAVLGVIVLTYAMASRWDSKGRHFHALYQFQLMGLCGAFLTGDAFNLFVFFEVLLIASYGLMLHGGGGSRVRAGLQYVAYNLVASTLFLFALATLYSVTGTLNLADLAVKLPDLPVGDTGLIRVAVILLLLVFAIKGALVPLHFWLPGAYANAPGVVAALFAVMTKVGAYAVLRFGTLVFPTDLPATGTMIADLMLPAGLVTLAVGAVGVLGARSLPSLAAFAAIASMGTVFTAMAGFTSQSVVAALYYIVHSTLAGATLFLVVDLVTRRRPHVGLTGAPPIAQSGAVGILFLIAAIAVAGLPPLSGFVAKLLVLQAWQDQALVVWSTVLVATFLMVLGFARAGSTVFWKPSQDQRAPLPQPTEPLALLAVLALVSCMAGLTVFAGPVTQWLDGAAMQLDDPHGYIAANRLYEER